MVLPAAPNSETADLLLNPDSSLVSSSTKYSSSAHLTGKGITDRCRLKCLPWEPIDTLSILQ